MGSLLGSAAAPAWRKVHWLAAAALLLLSLSLGWITRAPEVSIDGDEATYLLLSRSLEHGSYRDTFLPGNPLHAKYPPGAPFWLVLLRQLAGPDLDVVRGANLLLLVLTALLLGDAVRRRLGAWPGLAALGLTALSPPLLNLAGTALSEVPYTCLAVLALWSTVRSESDDRPRWVILAVSAALASFLTRTTGIAVIAAVLLWLLWRRAPRNQTLLAFALATLVVGGWFAYTTYATTLPGIESSYGKDLGQIGSTGPLVQAAANAKEYARMFPYAVGAPTLPGTILDNLLSGLVLAATLILGLIVLLRKWLAAVLHLVLATAVLLIWPWPVDRLWYPLLPFVFAAMVAGSFAAVRRMGARTALALPLGWATILATVAVTRYLQADSTHRCDRRVPVEDPACLMKPVRDFVVAARLLRDSAPPGAVIASGKPAPLFYFSGHRAVSVSKLWRPGRGAASPDLPRQAVDWILLSKYAPRDERAAQRALLPHCNELTRPLWSPSTTLILMMRPPGSTAPTACGALTTFLTTPPE